MNRDFDLLRKTRANFLKIASGLSETQLNTIPPGFNNNILWNLGHIWVTQQLLCYKLAGQAMLVSEEAVSKLKKGSAPKAGETLPVLESFKDDLLGLVERLEKDYQAGLFKDFDTYETSYGYTLSCIEDAIRFNNLHEGLHLGYVMALKRALGA